MALRQLHDDLWVLDRPQRFFGVELGTRMTVVRHGDDLLLHSPVAADDLLRGELEALGRVRWVVGPNRFHHLYLGDWTALGAHAWGVAGLHRKRTDLSFAGTVGQPAPWSDALDVVVLDSIPLTGEAVFFHAPSRTVIVSDLLFNLQPEAPLLSRALMAVGGGYPGVCCTVVERVAMGRAKGRDEVARILGWDFDRIVLAHGDVVADQGRDRLRHAYRWLGV